MSLMKRKIKRYSFIMLLILFLFPLISCNKITKSNYDKISIGMKKQEVIELLGLPNEELQQLTYDVYYWYDNATSFKDAMKKDEEGKEVKCIIITFSASADPQVTHKEYGSIKDFKGE